MAAETQPADLELRCLDPRCATLLPGDAEVCDECGGTAFGRLGDTEAVLLGQADDRPVGFGLHSPGRNLVGRSTREGAGPEVDLGRFPGSASVHRRHAYLEKGQGQWVLTHIGQNPVVISRPEETLVVAPGTSSALRSGDWVQFGRIRLQFLIVGSAPRL